MSQQEAFGSPWLADNQKIAMKHTVVTRLSANAPSQWETILSIPPSQLTLITARSVEDLGHFCPLTLSMITFYLYVNAVLSVNEFVTWAGTPCLQVVRYKGRKYVLLSSVLGSVHAEINVLLVLVNWAKRKFWIFILIQRNIQWRVDVPYTVYNLEQEHLKNKNLLATFWVGHENKALFFCFTPQADWKRKWWLVFI